MRRCVLLTACLAACTSHDALPATAVIDTLPGGIPRVTNSAPAGWADTNGWRFVELPEISPAAGSPGELIDPSGIAMDAARRLYVVDKSPVVIKQYDSSGTFIRTIGREGDGPGEFRVAYVAVRGNRLLVHDPAAQRTSLFDTSGTFIRSFHSVGRVWDQVALDAAGRAVLPTMDLVPSDTAPAREYVRFDSLGAVVDTIRVPQLIKTPEWTVERNGNPFLSMPVPFAPTTAFTFGPDSGLVYGATNGYTLVQSSGHGDTMRVWRRAWTPAPLSDSLRSNTFDAMVEHLKSEKLDEVTIHNALHLSDIPSTAPAFLGILSDDNGNTYTPSLPANGAAHFDVFDATGVWLGTMPRPAAFHGLSAGVLAHGMFVGVATGDDGLPMIRRWAIQDGQGGEVGQE